MKKIINGKRYDTSTARLVSEYESTLPKSDFYWFKEELYRKKTGEFFLCGEGHGMTRWAYRCQDGTRTRGSDILPLTEAEARAWVEQYDNDRYEIIFGECEE